MAFIRKIKAALVKKDIEDYIGESTYIFYDIVSGELRIHDGTPGGVPIFIPNAGGAEITVQDEGITISTAATLLNFAGDGVVVTEPGPSGEMLITIPGGGGGGGATLQLNWKFTTNTTSSDPGNKSFKYDNSTLASVTNIYVNNTTNSNADAGFILGKFQIGDVIYIQQTNNSANNVLFEISGTPIDNTGWFTIPVTVRDSGILHNNNQDCAWLLLRSGDASIVWGDITGTLSDQTDLQTALDNAKEEEMFAAQIDFIDDDLLYRGEATPGTATSAGAWRIRKITIDNSGEGDVVQIWADGNDNFDNIWDDRLILSYS